MSTLLARISARYPALSASTPPTPVVIDPVCQLIEQRTQGTDLDVWADKQVAAHERAIVAHDKERNICRLMLAAIAGGAGATFGLYRLIPDGMPTDMSTGLALLTVFAFLASLIMLLTTIAVGCGLISRMLDGEFILRAYPDPVVAPMLLAREQDEHGALLLATRVNGASIDYERIDVDADTADMADLAAARKMAVEHANELIDEAIARAIAVRDEQARVAVSAADVVDRVLTSA